MSQIGSIYIERLRAFTFYGRFYVLYSIREREYTEREKERERERS